MLPALPEVPLQEVPLPHGISQTAVSFTQVRERGNDLPVLRAVLKLHDDEGPLEEVPLLRGISQIVVSVT